MGVRSATLFLVMVLLMLDPGAEALRKASTLNLASMRIYTAELQLRESGARAGSVLEEHCRSQLESARDSLHLSSTKVVVNPDEARRELVRVDNFLQSCSQNLSDSQAHDLLTRVGQSVASAEYLIDQSETKQEALIEGAGDASTLLTTRVEERETGRSLNYVDVAMDDLVVDFCPNHVDLTRTSAMIRLDRACGGKFHTRARFSSGVFSIRMRAPEGAPGVSNSFYISSNDAQPDSISFDFVGSEPRRVLTAYAVNGDHDQKLKTFHMDFDTTTAFHDYTIKWDANAIVWMVDDVVIRTLRSRNFAYPTKPGHLFGYSWGHATDVPYFMSFKSLQIASSNFWRAPKQGRLASVRPLVIDYCPGNIAARGDDGVDIAFDKLGCGGRVRSLRAHSSGRFSARVQCAAGDTSGLLTSFYLSSGEGSVRQDEIDFEFLGDKKGIVQTNFYVNGTSAANELWVELGFDCSSGFHTYTIDHSPGQIQWFVDSRLVRTVVRDLNLAYPRKKMFLYSSVWNASFVDDGGWTGKWHGMGDEPFVAKFRDVTMQL
jgi:beta-glucanase (GH16 family)